MASVRFEPMTCDSDTMVSATVAIKPLLLGVGRL